MAELTSKQERSGTDEVGSNAPRPDQIMQMASGFMSAKFLFAANELGIFEALADSPTTIDGLAARTGLTRRATRIVADGMVALGLLEREGDNYRNGETAGAFLSGRGPADLRPFLTFWDKISYPSWTEFANTLAKGPAKEIFEINAELQEVASAGIEAILAGPASALPRAFDFSRQRRLLDVGGGTGSWSVAVVRTSPDIQATVLELPAVADVARKHVASAGLASRIEVMNGDAMSGDLPKGYDTFLLANLVHYWSPEQNRALLERVRRAAENDASLLLADFWTDVTHTKPIEAALMAGEFAAHVRNGDVYSVDEVRAWLDETGWRLVQHGPLAGPQSLIVAKAV